MSLFGTVRQNLLGKFPYDEGTFQTAELVRLSGTGKGSRHTAPDSVRKVDVECVLSRRSHRPSRVDVRSRESRVPFRSKSVIRPSGPWSRASETSGYGVLSKELDTTRTKWLAHLCPTTPRVPTRVWTPVHDRWTSGPSGRYLHVPSFLLGAETDRTTEALMSDTSKEDHERTILLSIVHRVQYPERVETVQVQEICCFVLTLAPGFRPVVPPTRLVRPYLL